MLTLLRRKKPFVQCYIFVRKDKTVSRSIMLEDSEETQ